MTLPVPRGSGSLDRFDPFRELTDMHRRMDQLMQSVLEPFGNTPGTWRPVADLSETTDRYLVELELPGVKQDDIAIEVIGSELAIVGEVKEKERVGWLRSRTRRTGRFGYRVSLPQGIDQDAITAELADGVLTVSVPKREPVKPRRIPIVRH